MFGLSLISTKKLNHLASECSKLAIANVELSKQNATQSKTIMELTGDPKSDKRIARVQGNDSAI